MDQTDARLLRRKRSLLLKRIATLQDFVRGSVVLMKRPCAYPRCRKCARGERHESWVMTTSVKGRTRTVYLGRGRLEEGRRMTAQYGALMDLIEQVSDINRLLLLARAAPSGRAGGGEHATGRQTSGGISGESR